MLDGHAMVGKVNCDIHGDDICRHPGFAGNPTFDPLYPVPIYIPPHL